MMKTTRVLLLLVMSIALGVTATGCGQVKEDKMAQRLESSLSSYRQAIRWGYYPAAVGFLHPESRTDIDLEQLKNIRVTGYEVIQPPIIDDDSVAVQLVQIDYVLNDRQVLRSLGDRQQWRYDEDSGAWWLHSGLPPFED